MQLKRCCTLSLTHESVAADVSPLTSFPTRLIRADSHRLLRFRGSKRENGFGKFSPSGSVGLPIQPRTRVLPADLRCPAARNLTFEKAMANNSSNLHRRPDLQSNTPLWSPGRARRPESDREQRGLLASSAPMAPAKPPRSASWPPSSPLPAGALKCWATTWREPTPSGTSSHMPDFSAFIRTWK